MIAWSPPPRLRFFAGGTFRAASVLLGLALRFFHERSGLRHAAAAPPTACSSECRLSQQVQTVLPGPTQQAHQREQLCA